MRREEAVAALFAFLNVFLPHSTKLSAPVSFTELIFGWRFKPSKVGDLMWDFLEMPKKYDRGFIICLLSNKLERLA